MTEVTTTVNPLNPRQTFIQVDGERIATVGFDNIKNVWFISAMPRKSYQTREEAVAFAVANVDKIIAINAKYL